MTSGSTIDFETLLRELENVDKYSRVIDSHDVPRIYKQILIKMKDEKSKEAFYHILHGALQAMNVLKRIPVCINLIAVITDDANTKVYLNFSANFFTKYRYENHFKDLILWTCKQKHSTSNPIINITTEIAVSFVEDFLQFAMGKNFSTDESELAEQLKDEASSYFATKFDCMNIEKLFTKEDLNKKNLQEMESGIPKNVVWHEDGTVAIETLNRKPFRKSSHGPSQTDKNESVKNGEVSKLETAQTQNDLNVHAVIKDVSNYQPDDFKSHQQIKTESDSLLDFVNMEEGSVLNHNNEEKSDIQAVDETIIENSFYETRSTTSTDSCDTNIYGEETEKRPYIKARKHKLKK